MSGATGWTKFMDDTGSIVFPLSAGAADLFYLKTYAFLTPLVIVGFRPVVYIDLSIGFMSQNCFIGSEEGFFSCSGN